MRRHDLSLSIFQYVRGVYKGQCKTLGEIASEARSFEFELNCWNEELDSLEGLSG